MKVLLCNVPVAQAPELALRAVADFGAACVNMVGPVRSIYRWQGEVCDEQEMTLLIKVAAVRLEALTKALVEAHPYDCPELLCLEVDPALSHRPYLDWVRSV